jgi:DNA polymerase-1
LILKWRQFSKLNSTYTSSLTKFADKDQRIHTNFRMCVTSTGRLSSIEPNLQNIPTRTEEGVKIRSNFIADQGKILISADYSQIELRLLANMANVKSLIEAFNHNLDIHSKTASEIFKIPLGEVNAEYRRKAKAINFGIIYGISAFGLANNLGISKGEAKHFIDLYFNEYPEIKDYITSTVEFARKNGFVATIFGRRCYLPGINDKNFSVRSFSERAAINAPIQGSQADIIKKAMIKIDQQIQQKGLKSRMVLQIHDELIIEAPIEEQSEITLIAKNEMELVTKLQVPTTVDISFGKNWGEL